MALESEAVDLRPVGKLRKNVGKGTSEPYTTTWGCPKIRGTLFGVLRIRILLFRYSFRVPYVRKPPHAGPAAYLKVRAACSFAYSRNFVRIASSSCPKLTQRAQSPRFP